MFNLERKNILAVVSILVSFLTAKLLTNYIKSRTPKSKKYGLLDVSTVIAFSVSTVIALLTKDPVIIALTILLSYFVVKSRYKTNDHYIYQLVLSIITGIAIPYFVHWLNDKLSYNSNVSYIEPYHSPSPRENSHDSSKDQRYEADSAPEYKLEDDEKKLLESFEE